MRKNFALIILIAAFVTLAVGAARAQSIERLGDHRDWSAFRFRESGELACYIASQPIKAEGNYTRRGDIYLMVTHRPSERRQDEVSVIAGYPYKPDSRVDVAVDGRAFRMFTADDSAWTPNADVDRQLVQAMKAGRQMVVKGISSRGTATTDTYSLLGFTAAYNQMSQACGVR